MLAEPLEPRLLLAGEIEPNDPSATFAMAPGDMDGTGFIGVINELEGITVSGISGDVTEAGDTASFEVVLDSEPTADVIISLSSSDDTEGLVSVETLMFTPADWDTAQTVTVTGVDDDVDDGDVGFQVVLEAASSADLNYNGIDPDDVAVTNWDDDTAAIVATAIDGQVTEAGDTAAFSLVLESEPTADVIVTLSSGDATEGSVSPQTLTFTAADWDTAQTATVTGVDDDVDDGDVDFAVVIDTASSGDDNYDGIDVGDVAVTNLDDDTAGVMVTAISGDTSEVGEEATFTFVLDSKPTANVTIDVSSTDLTEGLVFPEVVTFAPETWDAAQVVTVTGVDDDVDDGNVAYSIAIDAAVSGDPNYDGIELSDIEALNLDDDVAGIIVTAISGEMSEAGDAASFFIVLATRPTADVTIAMASTDTTEGTLSAEELTFAPDDWDSPQIVTVTGVDDDVVDGDIDYEIVLAAAASADDAYDGIDPANVAVTNLDDDVAGITVSPISGPTTESRDKATFSIVLDSRPTVAVTIPVWSSDTGEGTVWPQTLVFVPVAWDTPQVVTVTGADDDVADGDVSYTAIIGAASTSDVYYRDLDPDDLEVANLDDDTAGIAVSAIGGNTSEDGATASFSIVLQSEPTSDVVIAVNSSDTSEGDVLPQVLTFTPDDWDTHQSVMVEGVDDDVDDGDVSYTMDIAAASSSDFVYDGIDPADVAVTNLDDDTAGITVSAISGDTTEAGDTATFTIVLDSEPTGDVMIAVSSSDETEGTVSPEVVTFTSATWDVVQSVTVTGVDDKVDDGDIGFAVTIAAAASADAAYDGVDPGDLTLVNLNDDTVGITVSTISGDTSESGVTASFSVVLNSQPADVVRVDLMSSDTSEGLVTLDRVFFTSEDWDTPQYVTVAGVDDDIDDGDVDYVVMTAVTSGGDPAYDGIQADDVTVRNLDDDTAAIYVSSISGDTSETGAEATFSIVLGSEPTSEVTIELGSNDTTEGTVAISSVTFTSGDWDVSQMVTVAGVDDVLDDGDVTYEVVIASAASIDPGYDGLDSDGVIVTNVDDLLDGLPWQNSVHPCDVNGDGWITPDDILILINELNINGSHELPTPPSPGSEPPPYLDPSGDNEITPVDILLIVSYLNEFGSGPGVSASSGNGGSSGRLDIPAGEGEAAPLSAMLSAVDSGQLESSVGVLAEPGFILDADVERSTRVHPLPCRTNVGADCRVEFFLSEAAQDQGDWASSMELEDTLADIADDVNSVWASS